MLAKLKKAGKSSSSMLAVSVKSSPSTPSNPPNPSTGVSPKTAKKPKKPKNPKAEGVKNNPKIKPKGEKSKNSKKGEESEESSEEEDEPPKLRRLSTLKQAIPKEEHPKDVQIVGQAINSTPNPSNFIWKVLQTERSDLMSNSSLSSEEINMLNEHLLKKGIMKHGSIVTAGKVVDINSKVQVGSGDDLEVDSMQAYGRFGAVYLVYKEWNTEMEKRHMANFFALKTSRRHLCYARIRHEISILEHLYTARRRNIPYPTHITPLFLHGTAGGTPFFVMPMMDVNLEKVRQEMHPHAVSPSDAFFIGQESLVGIRECHAHSIIHRDIKPTNILLGRQNNRTWWICDFGDASSAGVKRVLSPFDSATLPFLSRDAHKAVRELIPATIKMDIESWFYVVLDLFTPLPWKTLTDEAEVLQAKTAFWAAPDEFLSENKLPSQVRSIANVVEGHYDEQIYSKLTGILKEGFHKSQNGEEWKPGWLEHRRIVLPSNRRRKIRKMKRQKKY